MLEYATPTLQNPIVEINEKYSLAAAPPPRPPSQQVARPPYVS